MFYMVTIKKRDKRDAIPSWNGYDYQGRIALVTVLDILCKIKNDSKTIGEYSFAIEDIEDFSIYYSKKLTSIHQVKAKNNSTVRGYSEALFMVAKNINNIDAIKGYLHVSERVNYENWTVEITSALKTYCKEKIEDFNEIIIDSDRLAEYTKKLGSGITKANNINQTISEERKMILQEVKEINGGFNHDLPLDVETVKKAIQNFMEKLKENDIVKTENISRIELYLYSNKQFLSVNEVDLLLHQLIKEYWGEEEKFKVGNVKYYRLKLQECITEHVRKRYEDSNISKEIPFKSICDILNDSIEIDGSMRLAEQKDKLSAFKKKYCNISCGQRGEGCDCCDLNKVISLLEEMTLDEFEHACYALCPHTTEDVLEDNAAELFTLNGTHNCMFPILKLSEKDAELNHNRILYGIDAQFYMLTALCISRGTEDIFIQSLQDNQTVENLFEKVRSNPDAGLIFREVDQLIVSSDYELKHKELSKYNTNIWERNIEPSYKKITGPKNVKLINKDEFFKLFKGEY